MRGQRQQKVRYVRKCLEYVFYTTCRTLFHRFSKLVSYSPPNQKPKGGTMVKKYLVSTVIVSASALGLVSNAKAEMTDDPMYFQLGGYSVEEVAEEQPLHTLQQPMDECGDLRLKSPATTFSLKQQRPPFVIDDPQNPDFPGPNPGFPGPGWPGGGGNGGYPGWPDNGNSTILDKIVNYGSKVWAFIIDNAPKANVTTVQANALPAAMENWADLECWSEPTSRSYRVVYSNKLGVDVVDYTFKISYTYGGTVGGTGRYLNGVQVLPKHVGVKLFWSLDAEAQVPQVFNMGTKTHPIAGLEALIRWKVKSPLTYDEKTENYFVRGDGGVKKVNVD